MERVQLNILCLNETINIYIVKCIIFNNRQNALRLFEMIKLICLIICAKICVAVQ